MEQLQMAEKEWRLGTSELKRLEFDAKKLKRGMRHPIQGPPRNELPVLMRQLEEERSYQKKMHRAPPHSRNPQHQRGGRRESSSTATPSSGSVRRQSEHLIKWTEDRNAPAQGGSRRCRPFENFKIQASRVARATQLHQLRRR